MVNSNWNVCRICTNSVQGMINIFTESNAKKYAEMFLLSGGLRISKDDHLPEFVCRSCDRLLRMANRVRQMMVRSHQHLSFTSKARSDFESIMADSEGEVLSDAGAEGGNAAGVEVGVEPALDAEREGIIEDRFFDTDDQISAVGHEVKEELVEEEADGENETGAICTEFDQVEGQSIIEEDEDIIVEEHAQYEMYSTQENDEDYTEYVIKDSENDELLSQTIGSEDVAGIATGEEYYLDDTVADDEDYVPESVATAVLKPAAAPKRRGRKPRDKNQTFVCETCGNSYQTKARLTEHKKFHDGVKPHECEICGHRFVQNQQLVRHMNTHTGQRPYKCNYCPAAFADRSTKTKHHRIHTKQRPYECDLCKRTFTYSDNLKFHLMTHTGEKPHVCDVCGKGFTKAYKMRVHRAIHEKQGQVILMEVPMDDGSQ